MGRNFLIKPFLILQSKDNNMKGIKYKPNLRYTSVSSRAACGLPVY